MSPFVGNMNQLIFHLPSYINVLETTRGLVPEFVNPKYVSLVFVTCLTFFFFRNVDRTTLVVQLSVSFPWCPGHPCNCFIPSVEVDVVLTQSIVFHVLHHDIYTCAGMLKDPVKSLRNQHVSNA